MGDTGHGPSVSLDGEERAAAPSTSPPRERVDTVVSFASSTPFFSSKEVLSALVETSNVDVSCSEDTGASTGDYAALQLPPRPEKAHKTSKLVSSRLGDRKRRKHGSKTPFETSPEQPLLSESQSETEIAGFGSVLNNVLRCVTNRELVTKTAAYMAAFPQHTLRFQIKMKQRAYGEGFQAKLMMFYVLHEFLKSFDGERLEQVQREWFQTVDEVLNACAREIRQGEKRNSEENRKRVFKTLARWEELKLYPRKIKTWKSLVMGECKPRRAPVSLPRSEAELQAEAPDQLQSFETPSPNTLQLQLDRSNCPFVFERPNFASKPEEKQHWRCTAIAFIDILSRSLDLSRDITFTACTFFHRVFDRGIYARERYKFAAACLFLSAKASSKRMKLLRMVRVMYNILETPLFAGDEELLEIERLQLLYYEMEVLQGINFELTAEMPYYYLRRTLEKMPQKFRNSINDDAQIVLEEFFFLPMCVELSPQLLGEAAAYIASWNKGKDFKFKWCSPSQEGPTFNERIANGALRSYRSLQRWKKNQQTEFDVLVNLSASTDGDKVANLKKAFEPQLGGLRLDPFIIMNEAEFTKKTEEDSKEWVKSGKRYGDGDRSSARNMSRRYNQSGSNPKRYRDEGEPRIKVEDRSLATSQEEKHRHGHSDDHEEDRYRQRSRSRSGSDSHYRRGNWSTAKHVRDDSRARSGEYRDRDRYDYDDYDDIDDYGDRDRYHDRKEDKYDSRYRSSTYDRDDRGNDLHNSRDLDFRRDLSYFNRRDRNSDRDSGSGRRERDSRSISRSSSRSQSPRNSSRIDRKRQRNYSSRGRWGSQSRSSSRSHSRVRSYRVESSSRSGRAKKTNKYGPVRSSNQKTDQPRIKQERRAV